MDSIKKENSKYAYLYLPKSATAQYDIELQVMRVYFSIRPSFFINRDLQLLHFLSFVLPSPSWTRLPTWVKEKREKAANKDLLPRHFKKTMINRSNSKMQHKSKKKETNPTTNPIVRELFDEESFDDGMR